MAGMRFVCLGTGDAFSALRYSSSLAVGADDAWLLIDCPHPIRKILRESGSSAGVALDVADIDAVVLTHLHADHASGLEGFAFYCHFALNRPAVVLAHPEVAADLWDHHLQATMGRPSERPDGQSIVLRRDDLFALTPLSDERLVRQGPFEIACRRTQHPVPTFALRITAGERTLAYSSDTSFDPKLIAWLADGADRIVHETNLGVHTPYEKLAALPKEVRRRMFLIHYPDDFEVASSVIEPLEQGRLYTV